MQCTQSVQPISFLKDLEGSEISNWTLNTIFFEIWNHTEKQFYIDMWYINQIHLDNVKTNNSQTCIV